MSDDHVTTNVRMPAAMHKALKYRAVEEGKSMAQLVRESVAAYLATADAVPSAGELLEAWERDTLGSIGAQPVEADVTDLSVHHDRYLYAGPDGADDGDRG